MKKIIILITLLFVITLSGCNKSDEIDEFIKELKNENYTVKVEANITYGIFNFDGNKIEMTKGHSSTNLEYSNIYFEVLEEGFTYYDNSLEKLIITNIKEDIQKATSSTVMLTNLDDDSSISVKSYHVGNAYLTPFVEFENEVNKYTNNFKINQDSFKLIEGEYQINPNILPSNLQQTVFNINFFDDYTIVEYQNLTYTYTNLNQITKVTLPTL